MFAILKKSTDPRLNALINVEASQLLVNGLINVTNSQHSHYLIACHL